MPAAAIRVWSLAAAAPSPTRVMARRPGIIESRVVEVLTEDQIWWPAILVLTPKYGSIEVHFLGFATSVPIEEVKAIRPQWSQFRFPDGSMYRGGVRDGMQHGEGEWRSAEGELRSTLRRA